MHKRKIPLPDLHGEAQEIIARLKIEGRPAAAEMLEGRIAGGATGTEILMGLSAGLVRTAFQEKGISWRLRKDMLVLSWRIDNVVKRYGDT